MGGRKVRHVSGSRPTSVCSTDSNYSSINLSQQMNSSSENPYGYGNSVQNVQPFASPHHVPHVMPYPPYYGNFAIIRPPQMSRKQMAYQASPYKKRLLKNGSTPVKKVSQEEQQIYSTFKPPNSALEGNIEGTKFILHVIIVYFHYSTLEFSHANVY